ncbi:MAG TPA: S8 family serine peptidase [Chthoniobacterales bacterium]|jgi:thermitase|nr:S8 family serine peptidase [Chthoniobacterales bacterium]
MSSKTPSSRAGLLDSLLRPIQKIIQSLLPAYAEAQLKATPTRQAFVVAADELLVRQFPLARLLPPKTRRNLIRKQLDLVIDEILLNDDLPNESVGAGFESFILRTTPSEVAPATQVGEAVRHVLGADWNILPLPLDERSFEVAALERALSVQDAWTLTYQLRGQPGIAQAEPNIIVPLHNLETGEAPPVKTKGFFGPSNLHGSDDCEWSLGVIRAKQAWQKAANEGRPARGEGILIGHPDTGYTQHLENWSKDPAKRRLLFEFGWDFWRRDNDPTDELEWNLGSIFTAGMIGNPGHGTGTSSVIFSDEGPPAGGGPKFVSGIAPAARLIPFRVAPTVVVWDQRRLADAIIAATKAGCHVLSISLGGLPLSYLQQAVIYAVERGVIVCAAAGNIFGANDVLHAVVWPAAYNEVLAVAASNVANAAWSGSSRGPQVDITAPGESVWHAIVKKGKPLREVERGSGTSFAVATTAGVAALWLAYHGRDHLVATYGPARIASIFRQIVVTQGFVRPANWKTNLFGAGIIDALKVLSAPLPPAAAIPSKAIIKQARFDQFASLFDDVPPVELRRGLARILKTTEAQLPARLDEVGDELLFHFFSDTRARDEFRAQLTLQKTGGPKGKAKSRAKSGKPSGAGGALAAIASPKLAGHLLRGETIP